VVRFAPSQFAPSGCESFDVSFPGANELEEINPTIFAGLSNGEESEILLDAFFRRCSRDHLTQPGKRFDRVLGVVVVPRNSVAIEKREEPVSVFLKPAQRRKGAQRREYESD